MDLRLYRARKKSRDGDREVNKTKKRALYKESEELFRQVIRINPRNGRAYVGLAKTLERMKQIDLAKRVLEDGCAATKGENGHIWQVWACLEAKQGDVRKARQYFDAAITADDTLISAYHSWAMLEQRQRNYAKAKQLLVKALARAEQEEKPQSHVYVALARLAERGKDFEAARAWYQRGVSSGNFRDCGPALTSWAILEAKQGNIQVSRDLFRKSLKGAKARYAWLSLGTWEQRWGNISEAREILKEANELFPADGAIAQAYAQAFTKSSEDVDSDMDLARELFGKAIEVDEDNQHAYLSWAMGEWLLAKDVDRARDLFQQGIWSGPTTNQAAKLFSTWAHLEAVEDQNIELARNLYSCAYKIKPRSTKILRNWAKEERKIGDRLRGQELEVLAQSIQTDYRRKLDSQVVQTVWPDNALPSKSNSVSGIIGELTVEIVDEFITKWNNYFESQKRANRNVNLGDGQAQFFIFSKNQN